MPDLGCKLIVTALVLIIALMVECQLIVIVTVKIEKIIRKLNDI